MSQVIRLLAFMAALGRSKHLFQVLTDTYGWKITFVSPNAAQSWSTKPFQISKLCMFCPACTSILGRLPVVQAGDTGTIQFKYRTLTLQQQCPLIQPYPRQGWLKTLGRGQMLHAPRKFLGNLNASGLWLPVVPWPVMMNEVWSVPCDSMCYFASWIRAGLLHSDTVPMVMKQDTFESICSI